jgi:hypothetical protein
MRAIQVTLFYFQQNIRHHPRMQVIHFPLIGTVNWIARTSRAMTVFG